MATLHVSPSDTGPNNSSLTVDPADIGDIIRGRRLRSVFQPIVDLDSGAVAAYEALTRGPAGPLEGPAELFAAARSQGLLAPLDEACRDAAFAAARSCDLLPSFTVFVNVEPEALDHASLLSLARAATTRAAGLRVVLEVTERALAARPAELLRTVEHVRAMGWGVALDDVGADPASLAFMALLQPDVVKLDLSLVQDRPTRKIAEIMNAVSAYAERSGALILAEGVETNRHRAAARALGATLGQGWLFGRPTARPEAPRPAQSLRLPERKPRLSGTLPQSPFSALPEGVVRRRSPKRLLVELSKHLESEAIQIGETCVVASTFQRREHFTSLTARRYEELVAHTGFVCVLGQGLPLEPIPGLRGATLLAEDPVIGEWDVVVLSPHFSAALLARDLGDDGPDMDRMFEYAVTYDRDTVVEAAQALLARVAPRTSGASAVF